jgi:membrane protein DedA with SNARE-associated domain
MPYVDFLIQHSPSLGLLLLLVLGAVGLPFPEDMTLLLCGFLISRHAADPVSALVCVYLGLLLSDFIIYSLGRKYGRKIVTHRRFRRILPPERLEKMSRMFEKRGRLVILLGRHFAGLRAQIFLTAGISDMPARRFLVSDAAAALVTLGLLGGLGYTGGQQWHAVRAVMSGVGLGAFVLVGLLTTGFLAVGFLRRRREMR